MVNRREVFYRAYEPNVTGWLKQAIAPGMTVYVVGAHLGIHVLIAARLLRDVGHVFAFEGWPDNCDFLRRNIACNPRLARVVTVIHSAVGCRSGTQRMLEGPSDGRHRLATADDPVDNTVAVPAVTLDCFSTTTGSRPDVVILDIEGSELDALAGAEEMLANCRPSLAIEHHRKQEPLTQWLSEHKYRIDREDRRHLFARPTDV